jgi:hypothetical protein
MCGEGCVVLYGVVLPFEVGDIGASSPGKAFLKSA